MWVAGHSSVRVGLKIGAEGVRLVAKHPGCSVVERWDIYIYIYIYIYVCVCVCVLWCRLCLSWEEASHSDQVSGCRQGPWGVGL